MDTTRLGTAPGAGAGGVADRRDHPGEKEKGYAATTIFASHNTRVAVAHTLPDELRKLERHGFDLAGF